MYRAAALHKRRRYQQLMDELDALDRHEQEETEKPEKVSQTSSKEGTSESMKTTAPSDPPSSRKQPLRRHGASKPAPPRRSLFAVFVTTLIVSLAMRMLKLKSALPRNYALCSTEGEIYTVDERKERVECIVVGGENILDTGSIEEMRARWGDKEKTGPVKSALLQDKNGLKFYFTNPGHVVVPGLTDAHAHILENGHKRQLELDGSSSIEEVLERVKSYVLSRPEVLNDTSIWIQGMGWDQTKWPGAAFPTASEFEKEPILRDRPIYLRRVDGHAAWVSYKVLELTGPLPDKVAGGEIVRDGDGKPTGVFVDNAISLISLPPWSKRQMLEYFNTTVTEALSVGLTSIHDADTTPQMISFFKEVADEGALPIRLYMMASSSGFQDTVPEKFINYGPAGRLTLRAVKMYADGALGSWGAALREPYTDHPETKGLLLTEPKELRKHARRFWEAGLQVNIHAIGDRANEVVLDVFEEFLSGQNVSEHRPRIEHAQIMSPDDVVRLSRLGVIPSVQPTHATSDMWYAETRLGRERIKTAYVYKSQLNASQAHVLPLGSDFPIEGVNPLLGFYAAIARLSTTGGSPHGEGGWFPEQRLTRHEALKGMTLDPAYASFQEESLGSLTPGKRADYVVLDTNIMTVPFNEILKAKVVATVIDGRPAYGKLN